MALSLPVSHLNCLKPSARGNSRAKIPVSSRAFLASRYIYLHALKERFVPKRSRLSRPEKSQENIS